MNFSYYGWGWTSWGSYERQCYWDLDEITPKPAIVIDKAARWLRTAWQRRMVLPFRRLPVWSHRRWRSNTSKTKQAMI